MDDETNGSAGNSIALTFTAWRIVGAAVAVLSALSKGHLSNGELEELAEEVKEKERGDPLLMTIRLPNGSLLRSSAEPSGPTGYKAPETGDPPRRPGTEHCP